MSSVCTSLFTDPPSAEVIDHDLDELSYCLENSRFGLTERSHQSFPNISNSIRLSIDDSKEIEVIRYKNTGIKDAIIYEISKLKASSRQILNKNDLKSSSRRESYLHAMKPTDLTTREGCSNVRTLKELVLNVKSIKKRIARNRLNLNKDIEAINSLSDEQDSLKMKLEEVTLKIHNSVKIDQTSAEKVSCGCEVF